LIALFRPKGRPTLVGCLCRSSCSTKTEWGDKIDCLFSP